MIKKIFVAIIIMICLFKDYIVDQLNKYPSIFEFILSIIFIVSIYVLLIWLPNQIFGDNDDC